MKFWYHGYHVPFTIFDIPVFSGPQNCRFRHFSDAAGVVTTHAPHREMRVEDRRLDTENAEQPCHTSDAGMDIYIYIYK